MVTIDDAETTIITAQNVQLLVSSLSGTVATDILAKMREVEIEKEYPETRINHGKKRSYTHASPDIMIRFMLTGSKSVLEYLKTRNTANAQNVLPTYSYLIKCTADDGIVKNLSVLGKLPYKRILKNDGDPQNAIDVECRVRITDTEITIS